MDILRKSRGKWTTYVQNPSGNWFYQHMETMNTRTWQSENQMAGEEGEADTLGMSTQGESTSAFLRDSMTAEHLPEEQERQQRPQVSDCRDIQMSKKEANYDNLHIKMTRGIQDMRLGHDGAFQSAVINQQRTSAPLREAIQILREQLEEVKRAREHEEKEAKQSVRCIQETFKDELLAERSTRLRLEEELKEAKLSHQQDCIMYRNELKNFHQQTENFQRELEQEVKQRELLQKECEELQQSLKYSQESLSSMLQAERKMKQLLHEQLKESKLSHQQDCVKFRTELNNIKQQADNYKSHLQKEIQQRTLIYKEHNELKHYVKSIQEAFKTELQAEREMKQLLQKQLREAKLTHQEECTRWKTELEKFQREAETFQRELLREVEQKELLRQEHERLQHSLKCAQEALTSMLHSDKKMKQLHQEQLREAKLCHEEDCIKFRTELKNLQQQAENLKCQLQREIQQRTIFQEVHEEMKESLKCSQESFTFLLQAEREMNQQVQKELNEVRRSCLQDCMKYYSEITDAEQLTDGCDGETEELCEHQELPQKQHEELKAVQPKKQRSKCNFFKKLFKSMRPGSKQKNQPENLPQTEQKETYKQDILTADLHGERENALFQEMLYADKVSPYGGCFPNITGLINIQQQAETSQPELQQDIQQKAIFEMIQEARGDILTRGAIPGPSFMP